MNERRVLDLIEQELRRRGIDSAQFTPRSALGEALRRAALQIAREAESNQRNAARSASLVGFSITRGRSKL